MPHSQEAREVYDLRSIMSPEYSRAASSLPSARPNRDSLYATKGLYDAEILTMLAVNTHNVLGSSHMKGDLWSRVYEDWENFGSRRVARQNF